MQKYLDVMREALNKGTDKQSYYWRAHRSLNGWTSMNYPSTLSNPMLKRRPNPINPERIAFTNLNKPISAPKDRVRRPLTAVASKGRGTHIPLPVNHNYYNQTKAELLLITDSENDDSRIEETKQPFQADNYVSDAYNLPKYHRPSQIGKAQESYKYRKVNNGGYKQVKGSLPPSLGIDYSKRS